VRWATRRRYTDCLSVLVRADRADPGGPQRVRCDTFVDDMSRAANRDRSDADRADG
jgi:hypothetical protein